MTAVVLLGLVVVSYLLGRSAFFVLATTVVLIALFEQLDGLVQAGHRPNVAFGLAMGFGMLLVAFLQRPALLVVVLAVTLFGAFLLALRPARGASPASDVAWTFFGVAWIGGGGAAAVSMLMLDPGGLVLLIAFVLITAADDVAAYFVGTRFGRHRLAPSVSPAKSWEGAVGGLAGSLLAGLAFAGLLDELTVANGLALGLICGLLAPAGDLVESMFKREVGIKDSGRVLPGHGGFLDRLDAIVFCAPPAYLYLLYAVG